mmetsp:Transcript_12697/g.27620  ORF Transcript_12697/g.27620 Transcript_12697/m.27620 type:complete len:394 (+) Transcript_12697:187-1368(+)
MTLLSLSSNSPRIVAPATRAPISSPMSLQGGFSVSGTSPVIILCAMPSAIAVLPTPGSPMRTGLFFVRRDSICMALRISSSRPMTGSSFPSSADLVKSIPYFSSASYSPSALRLVTLAASPSVPAASLIDCTASLTSSRLTPCSRRAFIVNEVSFAHSPRRSASVETYVSRSPSRTPRDAARDSPRARPRLFWALVSPETLGCLSSHSSTSLLSLSTSAPQSSSSFDATCLAVWAASPAPYLVGFSRHDRSIGASTLVAEYAVAHCGRAATAPHAASVYCVESKSCSARRRVVVPERRPRDGGGPARPIPDGAPTGPRPATPAVRRDDDGATTKADATDDAAMTDAPAATATARDDVLLRRFPARSPGGARLMIPTPILFSSAFLLLEICDIT